MNQQLKTVLVVDDDQTAMAFVRAALDSETCEVTGEGNGLAGLDRALKDHPDLIILDVYMPGKPGFYTLRDLKNNPKTRDIPVILLTGVGKRLGIDYTSRDLYDFLGTEPDAYLEKPVDPVFLRGLVSKLLKIEVSPNGQATKEG
jgi:CheY-like chemotaxis protein